MSCKCDYPGTYACHCDNLRATNGFYNAIKTHAKADLSPKKTISDIMSTTNRITKLAISFQFSEMLGSNLIFNTMDRLHD